MARSSRPPQALAVWVNGRHVADWRIRARGDELQYQKSWAQAADGRPLSLSLPLTLDNDPIKGEAVQNYFDNLLPESEPIRQRIQTRFRTRSRIPFDLLAAVGRECIGAVQLLPEDDTPRDVDKISARPLSDLEIEAALIDATRPAPGALDAEAFRISIAGAQEKSAFLLHEGRWCRPIGATPTTHIFKLPLGLVGGRKADLTTSVENEWLCAKILRRYGMPVAKTEMAQFGSEKVLVVERFDRQLHSSGKYWLRLVQEDFCQALGIPSSLKYERDGGPGPLEIARVLRNSENRDDDLAVFFKAQVLFWMLAAGDGHAKNFSLRILSQGRYHLTPLYDVLSYWPIIGNGPNKLPLKKVRLAMAMRGKNKHDSLFEIKRKHFNQTAARAGIGGGAENLIEHILSSTPEVLAAVEQELPKGFPDDVAERIFSGLRQSASALEQMAP